MIKAVVFDLYGTLIHGKQLFPEVYSVLNRLQKTNYSLGLISNATAQSAPILFELGIRDYFASIVWAYDCAQPKPYPEPFLRALSELNVSPEEVLYIGDSEDIDAKGAEAIGMFAVQIKREGELGFHRRIKSLEDIFQFLEE